MMLGFTPAQCGNLVAAMMGIHAVPRGWTKKQLKDMLFYQELEKHIDH